MLDGHSRRQKVSEAQSHTCACVQRVAVYCRIAHTQVDGQGHGWEMEDACKSKWRMCGVASGGAAPPAVGGHLGRTSRSSTYSLHKYTFLDRYHRTYTSHIMPAHRANARLYTAGCIHGRPTRATGASLSRLPIECSSHASVRPSHGMLPTGVHSVGLVECTTVGPVLKDVRTHE